MVEKPEQPFADFSDEELFAKPARASWKIMLPVWAALLGLVWAGEYFGLDEHLIAATALLFGVLSSAFVWLVGTIGLVPLVGPVIVKLLAIPVLWLLNAIAHMVTYFAIRRGHASDVLTSRGLTIALLVGVVIGYVMGKLI
jgi:hypothetical protein